MREGMGSYIVWEVYVCQVHTQFVFSITHIDTGHIMHVASFPGPARSSLAVRYSRRGSGLVHHVMCATAYVTTLLLESMMS